MKYKTKLLVDRFSEIFSGWPGVECVALNEAALPDTLDPYFALIMDVYYTDTIPGSEERYSQFGTDILAFETSHFGSKDRFLIGDVPVRLEYKSTQTINEFVSIADTDLGRIWFIKDSGTYGYYRLAKGEVLFCRNNWMAGIRERLAKLSPEFWQQMRGASQSRMEHFLSDLGAAFIQEDDFHYLISSSGFIKNACLTLFCINRCFEPSHRAYYKQVLDLPVLPEAFAARLESFLRNDAEMTIERKYNLAQLIARSIVGL
ncbi:DUF4037 domain-containing protein [Breznakiella homolactica]|uniref:DUF4037 domain-containing protein n=2 Tax=Breznakiella homolactica TaxID=2798577 RepID=A0A7T7XS07_9SPIR|nr:DUF4037 domain-containing protein [Breznakiella homolactica]